MRVFLTGATGFIGSALVPELIHAGHQVIGLTRSDSGAQSLAAAGAQPHYGTLENLDSLRAAAAQSDAVIHTAFIHDFSRFQENCAVDRRAIETLGAELAGSGRTLIVTSGLALLAHGRLANENDPPVPVSDDYPRASEQTAASFEQQNVRAMVVRLPQVHDTQRQGLVSYSIQIARQQGAAAYISEGQNRWAAVHRFDAARLYRLALEKGHTGARYHAVAEEGVTARAIAEAIARGLNIPAISLTPEQAPAHFGWLTRFAAMDLTASSAQTREQLGWNPTGPGLITDLNNMQYAQAEATV
jgi:nucleoside-diphosphate-sugar epimerase